MKLTLVAQASILIETPDRVIWTDPWLFGAAFNDSWRLMPEACFDERDYQRITDLWISHEHPDHFHIATLKAIPADFKARVTVWFQQNNSDKLPNALQKMGFKDIRRMPHRQWMNWSDTTRAYCAQIGQMDACLAVQSDQQTILNLNDCEVGSKDCRWLKKDIGQIDALLNQFSLAGYSGEADRERHLPEVAKQIRQNVVENHRDLQAKVTVPIASFVYFCKHDNFYLNQFANRLDTIQLAMQQANQQLLTLYPGDTWEVNSAHDSQPALARYAECYANQDQWQIDPVETIPLAEIEQAFHRRVEHFRSKYPRLVLRQLQPVLCKIPDLGVTVRFSLADDTLAQVEESELPDVEINSQPLHFMFRWPWGLQTLGVSARLVLHRKAKNWRRHRILFAMDNAEIYLRPTLLFTKNNLSWFSRRLSGGLAQLRYQLRRMRPASKD